jgi:cellobiose-specific phosphotransferase system component IIC
MLKAQKITTMTKANLFLLKLGTLQTVLMGLYHFYIPFQYNWSNYLEQKSPTINWSLFSLNNYFSFNLLVVAIFLGYYLLRKQDKKEVIKILTSIILLFWIFSTAYQLIEPMPLPEHLKWIGSILLVVAFLNGLIFIIPLISLIKKK